MKNDTKYEVMEFGHERQLVVIIDNYSSEYSALKADARQASYEAAGNHYPGHRALAPPSYLGERAALLKEILIDVFELVNGAELVECSYSLVTTPPSKLTPIQRMPHFDGTDPNRLALLHYCEGEAMGGTSFYRHRATGYETVNQDRFEIYTAALKKDIADYGLPPAEYHSGSNEQFEQIFDVPSHQNRMIIYRGLVLHSGNITTPPGEVWSPEKSRLTINTFLSGRA